MSSLKAPATPGAAIRVMIVDDSAVVRTHLSELLTRAGIEVIATASDPVFARERLRHVAPDVIVLDVEMPRQDGLSFLRELMAERPTPVVMCSTLTERGAETTLQALAAGAVGIVAKPRVGLRDFMDDPANGVVAAVRAAARARVGALRPAGAPAARAGLASGHGPAGAVGAAGQRPAPVGASTLGRTTEQLIAIGISTGGVQALERLLLPLPRTLPGIVVVQHMPERFTAAFATRLDGLCEVDVREARHGDRVLPGSVLIAPGGRHLRLARSGAQYVVEVVDGPPVNHHKPSVDVLFRSVAQHAGRNALGIIMTGMGDDGARGLKAMHEAGARTAAQDEASCVVFGMPEVAIRLGGVDEVLPLDAIGGWMTRQSQSV
ncbi:protein-glutamate methylesterase/protein-glutamine glutaminase [Derxia lacustris]|uniref:protein-glutamate methylesterase/protein-glutamine glutaminase n=1 Tax=Derxia lacustris TaxID=764842 RepID=UPI000A17377B|nr:chemotaxis response regulator protein-glutamate methylesterase [Derxia lacustris]